MKAKISIILALSFTLAGCGERATPNGTVEALIISLHENDVAKFRDTLTRSAKATRGTSADMEALKATIHSRMPSDAEPTLRTEEVSRNVVGTTTVVHYRVAFGDDYGAVVFNSSCRSTERVRPSTANARTIDTSDRVTIVTRCYVSSWE